MMHKTLTLVNFGIYNFMVNLSLGTTLKGIHVIGVQS